MHILHIIIGFPIIWFIFCHFWHFCGFLFWQVDRLSDETARAFSAYDRPSDQLTCQPLFTMQRNDVNVNLPRSSFSLAVQRCKVQNISKSLIAIILKRWHRLKRNWPQFHVLNFSFALVISLRLLLLSFVSPVTTEKRISLSFQKHRWIWPKYRPDHTF